MQLNLANIENSKQRLLVKFPLSEIISDFFDRLKSLTKGYGSMDYEYIGYEASDIQKLQILIMHEPVDALTFLVHRDRAKAFGKQICKKMKEKIPSQLFTVTIQAKLANKIIAKEEIPSMRKNVTAKCYGGDYTRKKKLLERQKEGKKRMRQLGKVNIPSDLFMEILKK